MRIIRIKIVILLFLMLFTTYTFCQESGKKDEPSSKSRGLMIRLSDQDVILPITSIEWGHPDRWSFTMRYIHSFHKERKRRVWHHGAGISLHPGWSGGRLGFNYSATYSPPYESLREFAIFIHLSGTLLRTWGNPLTAITNTTYAGPELKIGLSWLLNITVGYYSPILNDNVNPKPFWGFHFGIGI
ncbi:MAG: hypothetical protein ABFS12_03375 [Bacteroidota bacterium]